MLNQVAVEALYSATYVENYLDSVENLPEDVQRHLSRIRDIDVQYRSHLRDVDYYYEQWRNSTAAISNSTENSSTSSATTPTTTTSKRVRAMARIQQSLIAAQELGDEKLQIVNQLQELIDHKTRQLDIDFKNLDYGKEDLHHHHSSSSAHHHHNTQDSSGTTMSHHHHHNQQQQQHNKMQRPSSPSMQTNQNNMKIEAVSTAFSTVSHHSHHNQHHHHTQRGNTPTANQTILDRSSNTNSGSERLNKRSRRPRNDNSSIHMDIDGTNINSVNDSQHKHNQSSNQSSGGGSGGGSGSSSRNQKQSNANNKKKKRKTKGQNQSGSGQSSARDTRDDTPQPEEAIDPDEPTYCLCDQISFGEMILCDNDLCPIEWFHFSCVSLMSKPKGKWFCPNCRGDRPNVMKPKAQFLKELERYNKEKEEKT